MNLRPRTRKQWIIAVAASLFGICLLCGFVSALLDPASPPDRAAVVELPGSTNPPAAPPTATPEPPTATPEPPTATPEPPTATPEPPTTATPTPTADNRQKAVVTGIVDGDTIRIVRNGEDDTIRYIGIDAPETNDAYGPQATAANRQLVEGQTIYLESDTSNRDRYGRLLRYVYLDDGRMVNEELVSVGHALSVAYPPDTAHQALLDAAQQRAQAAGTGMWQTAWASGHANLRSGPGTNYDVASVITANTPLQIVAVSPGGDWYQVATGAWIAAFLVAKAPADLPVATVPVPPTPTAAPTQAGQPTAVPPDTVVTSPDLPGIHLLIIQNVSRLEILEIRNTSPGPVDISGWLLYGSRGDDRCLIPAGVVLQPGEGYQIATGDSQPTARGYKCGDKPIWNNQGETIYLRTPDGQTLQIET